jgi:hypothetical protein
MTHVVRAEHRLSTDEGYWVGVDGCSASLRSKTREKNVSGRAASSIGSDERWGKKRPSTAVIPIPKGVFLVSQHGHDLIVSWPQHT